MFHELQTWTRADTSVAAQALPHQVSSAFTDSLNKLPPGRLLSLPVAKAGTERVSVATFAVALCILAMQVSRSVAHKRRTLIIRSMPTPYDGSRNPHHGYCTCVFAQSFPQDLDDHRVVRLIEWLLQGGGPSIVARSS